MELEDEDPIRLQPLRCGLAEFNKWLEERRFQGLYLHPCLTFIHHPRWQYGIGAYFVGNRLTDGTVVARIPKEFILSVRTTSSHNLRAALELENIKGILGLSIAYIYESCRKKESPFYGYLSCFACPDVPRLWTDDQRDLLAGTEIDVEAGLSLKDFEVVFQGTVRPFFRKYSGIFPPPVVEKISELVFAKAYITVASRCFQVDNYHGVALVPIADMFNHTYSGNEDISFECNREVCNDCGGPLDSPCSCHRKECDHCTGTDLEAECICRPTKRQKTDSESLGQTLSDDVQMQEIMTVDPTGSGWKSKTVRKRSPSAPDTCDLILIQDITEVRQVFNCYGSFNNARLLCTYGFIDTECQTDTVSLRYELFDLKGPDYQACSERREFWKSEGYKIMAKLAKYSPDHERELEIILDLNECPTTGNEFVSWSLSVGKHGWVRFPLKLWVILCCLSDDEWKAFRDNPETVLPMIAMFETRDIYLTEFDFFEKWLNLLKCAINLRYERYEVAADHTQWMLAHKRYNMYPSNEYSATRKSTAFWFKGNEMQIISDCEKRVSFALATIQKYKTKVEGDVDIPINKAFRASEDPKQIV